MEVNRGGFQLRGLADDQRPQHIILTDNRVILDSVWYHVLCLVIYLHTVFKIRFETCRTAAQFWQNLYMTKKESLLDRRKFCRSGSAVRHLFWRLFIISDWVFYYSFVLIPWLVPWSASHEYKRDLNMTITVAADALALNCARPTAGSLLTTTSSWSISWQA